MHVILFDNPQFIQQLKPFTFTRPIAEIRCGILTIREKWEYYLQQSVSHFTSPYLQAKYPIRWEKGNNALFINSAVLPHPNLVEEICHLRPQEALQKNQFLIAYCAKDTTPANLRYRESENDCNLLENLTDIFVQNGQQIELDFQLITKGKKSALIKDPHTVVYKPENVFLEEGVEMKACILNGEKGVIYLGKNVILSEGAIIQGNFALCENSVINLGAKIRSNTTIGPYCKVGGEVSNCIFFGYSNKAHDGFLGNSVVGEWCNLGADTNNSNLKNNYTNVKLWSYAQHDFLDTQRQFVGVMIGDHTKIGINTMLNTGTVIGVSANIFGEGFPPKHVPSFVWGGGKNWAVYQWEKAIETAKTVMGRRNVVLDEIEEQILREVFEMTIES